MRSVVITKFIPSPTASGGQQRTFEIVSRLRLLGPTTVCAFDDGSADPVAVTGRGVTLQSVPWQPNAFRWSVAAAGLRSLTTGRFWSPALARKVREATDVPPDLLQVEHLQLVPYAAGRTAQLRVLDLHNMESLLTASFGATRHLTSPLYKAEARALRRLERRAVHQFDVVTVVSEADGRSWQAAGGSAIVCPNGCNPAPPIPPARDPVAVFVATMGWAPNADAARWLVHEVWPRVLARVPEARLCLVGRDPPRSVRALTRPGVEVTGAVRSVTPYLARARLALATLRAGGGSRLKILEALAAGRPVVATTTGVAGLEDLVGQGVVVADTPDSIAGAVSRLLLEAPLAETLGRRGRAAVRESYSWDQTLAPLLQWVTA